MEIFAFDRAERAIQRFGSQGACATRVAAAEGGLQLTCLTIGLARSAHSSGPAVVAGLPEMGPRGSAMSYGARRGSAGARDTLARLPG